ncbi:hypothetical protein ONS96_001400 [Cadophora gregata f. sp. sojae]|nr:hypothetical protein ONS96_001400 [Cadophora gregata f. sp. sojae]
MASSFQLCNMPNPNPSDTTNLIGSPANRRREKPQLSCNLCRRRKLKCDRRTPCSTCAMRGLSASCTYVPISGTGSRPRPEIPKPLNMQDKLEQLEHLVISLKRSLNEKSNKGQAAEKASLRVSESQSHDQWESKDDEVLDGVGSISLENDGANYFESAHWTAILAEISDLKDQFEGGFVVVDSEPEPVLGGLELPFGQYQSATKEEIIMAISVR